MRIENKSHNPLTRGYLSADEADMAYRSIVPWYKLIEPLYAELEALMQQADNAESAYVLAQEEINMLLARSYQIRAAYEFDKEMEEAKALLGADHPAQSLVKMVEHQSYWTLSDAVIKALQGARHVAVIGSGPLPLTALSIAAKTDCNVTCYERDVEAFDLGNQIVALSPDAGRITCLNENADGGPAFQEFDAVFTAVLLGVSLNDIDHRPKSETIGGLFDAMRPATPVILRDPYRLGALFYPPADIEHEEDMDVQRFDPQSGPGIPYRSSFLILRKCAKSEA